MDKLNDELSAFDLIESIKLIKTCRVCMKGLKCKAHQFLKQRMIIDKNNTELPEEAQNFL